MIVFFLGSILIGAILSAVLLWLGDASWGMIALGYLLGGWAGLVVSLPLLFLIRSLQQRRAARMQDKAAARHS